ncbi:hypothetical protein OCU04_002143 [Sclerotinia nivalis]|uniref:Rhodopsin domain-containing protein n=1 Tax=Sclerotinia nivalis TaxID=352851 RepID=A0A9X0AZW2_9HELO|nr:hypothetical protein OCU04_002143 [Sclerotinia nivalis]
MGLLRCIQQAKLSTSRHNKTNSSSIISARFIYSICIAVTKVAILILHLRLAISKVPQTIIWGVRAFVIPTPFSFVITTTFQCTPISQAWEQPVMDKGHCIGVNALLYANAALHILQVLIVYILPMKIWHQIQIPKRKKYALMSFLQWVVLLL